MAESERLDELFKYFRTASISLDHDIDLSAEFKPSVAQLNPNPVLNALAQLAACRLDCDRAFVSLIDDRNQYLVAEVTRSSSLYHADHHPSDGGIAFGVRAMDLATGICAATIPPFTGQRRIKTPNITADSNRYVVNDFSREEGYQDKPYVQGFPFFRYYAGVPLRTDSGHVIGTFAVIHNASREGLDGESHRVLTEIASSIMRHFELQRIQSNHETAIRLLHGLKRFVRDDALTDTDASDSIQSQSPQGSTPILVQEPPPPNGNDAPFGVISQDFGLMTDIDQDSLPSAGHSPKSGPQPMLKELMDFKPISYTDEEIAAPTTDHAASVSITSSRSRQRRFQPSVVQDRYHEVLIRAAGLFREAMCMDVVGFVPAPSSAVLRGQGSFSSSVSAKNHSERGPPFQQSSKMRKPSQTEAGNLIFVASDSVPDVAFNISEELHARLLFHYPRGCFLNFTNYLSSTPLDTTSRASLHKALRSALPAARSLMYLPLFGPDGTCVRSLFVWSYEKPRILQKEDFSYLGLFGATIEAKFSQIETAIQSRAKSDFISSMSHELRSPLHGILGSAELLSNSSNIDSDQEEMLSMIEKCAGSLLTTLDHIMTYSKINNRAKDELLTSFRAPNDENTANSVDLSMLVEDTVDTLTAGNHFRKISSGLDNLEESRNGVSSLEAKEALRSLRQGPLVNLVIDGAPSWSINSEGPVWVRSLTNVLGNAMKYTASGIIEVKLQMFSETVNNIPGQTTNMVKLSVSDTGRGMTAEFQTHLYQPFLQENSTSDGLGLGLSIVKKLVDGLGGSIDIQSKVGKGTTVEISVQVPVSTGLKGNLHTPVGAQHRGKRIYFMNKSCKNETDTKPDQKTHGALSSAISLYCEQWFDMDVRYSPEEETMNNSVIIMFHDDFYHVQQNRCDAGIDHKSYPGCAFVVISTKFAKGKHPGWLKGDGVFLLVPPFGPRRLSLVLQQAFEYTDKVKNSTVPSLDPSTLREIPTLEMKSLDMASPSKDPAQEDRNGHDLGEKHILVVDDNEVNVKLLTKCLAKWNVSHQTAYNGAEALEAFQNTPKPFDYILMDISMPVMNGIEATRAIRELEIVQRRPIQTHIIAMTGLGDEKTRSEALECGMDVFLTKPVRLKEVKSLIGIGGE